MLNNISYVIPISNIIIHISLIKRQYIPRDKIFQCIIVHR